MLPFWNPSQLLPMSYVYVPSPISNLGDFPFGFYNFNGFSNSPEFLNFQIPTAPFQPNFYPQFVVNDATATVVAVTKPPARQNTVIPADEQERKKIQLWKKLKNRPTTYRTERRIHQDAILQQMARVPRMLRQRKYRKQPNNPGKQIPEGCQIVQQEGMREHQTGEKIGEGLNLPVSRASSIIEIQGVEGEVMVNSRSQANPDGIVNQRKASKAEEVKLLSVDV